MTSPTTITEARIRWLAKLQDGPARRTRGKTGITCMRAGWTSWVWIKPGGEPATSDDVTDAFGTDPGAWGRAREAGWEVTHDETLTALGRRILFANRDLILPPPTNPAKD